MGDVGFPGGLAQFGGAVNFAGAFGILFVLVFDAGRCFEATSGRGGKSFGLLWVTMGLLLRMLDSPPPFETQTAVAEFELYVQSGRYERLLRQPEKFEEQEKALLAEQELGRAWEEIKRRFATEQYRNSRGVIRRRMAQERNFRDGWEFDWADDRRRFELFFDAMCYRWKLYGMEGDRPLLLKVSVNPTAHGTMIVIPRHWSLDPHRDLDWTFIGKLHRSRGTRKQGPKLSAARMARMEEARLAKGFWEEAKRKGLSGEARYNYVREQMGRDARMDPKWLRRLLRQKGVAGRK